MIKGKPVFKTKLGKLYKGDCLKLLSQVEDNSIDCFFADPPFNLNKSYGIGINDSLSEEVYLNWCRQWIAEGIRILKPGGSFFLYNLPKWNVQLVDYIGSKFVLYTMLSTELSIKSRIQSVNRISRVNIEIKNPLLGSAMASI